MTTVNIGGLEYPLYLTIGAFCDMEAQCEKLDKITRYLSGNSDLLVGFQNTMRVLHILLQGGQAAQKANATMLGEPWEPHEIPTLEALQDLSGIATPGMAVYFRSVVMDALGEGMKQSVTVEPEKSKKKTEPNPTESGLVSVLGPEATHD